MLSFRKVKIVKFSKSKKSHFTFHFSKSQNSFFKKSKLSFRKVKTYGVDRPGIIRPGIVRPGIVRPGIVRPGIVRRSLFRNGFVRKDSSENLSKKTVRDLSDEFRCQKTLEHR